jgi:hypothetical protein
VGDKNLRIYAVAYRAKLQEISQARGKFHISSVQWQRVASIQSKHVLYIEYRSAHPAAMARDSCIQKNTSWRLKRIQAGGSKEYKPALHVEAAHPVCIRVAFSSEQQCSHVLI